MLDFLKKIFIEEVREKKQIHEIDFFNLPQWLNERSKPIREEIKTETGEILMKISEELQRTRFNIDIIENAKLQNPNIPFKAKQYMEGNRAAYIKSVSSFLGHMEINNKDYYYLLEFCKTFDRLLNELHTSTLRSYTILQEFFANETNKISQNIKNFDLLFKELKMVLNDVKMVKANNAAEKSKQLDAKIKQKINLDVDLKNAEASLKLAVNEKESIMASIENFNSSESHLNFKKLNEEKKQKAIEFAKIQDSLFQIFSSLERPLRKYSHIAFQHEELVLEYLKDPISTLASDKNLEILDVMSNMERMLMENGLSIDDKKKEKYIEEVRQLKKEFLQEMISKYSSLKTEIADIESKIIASAVAEKFKEFNKSLTGINTRIERNTEEYEKIKSDSEKLYSSLNSMVLEIQDSIKEAFKEEVKVKIN